VAAPAARHTLRAMQPKGPAAYVAELIGTFLLVLFIGFILASNSPAEAGGLGYTDFAVIGLLHAFVLMMLIASLGGVSGAHFNPAVTVTLAALRKISWGDAAVYILLQLAGAVLAALTVNLVLTGAADATNFGAIAVNDRFVSGDGAAALAELIGTFALMWAIMGVAVNPEAERSWAPWVIGGTLGFAVMAIGPFTGAGLNPARAFGPGPGRQRLRRRRHVPHRLRARPAGGRAARGRRLPRARARAAGAARRTAGRQARGRRR
jgi:glycerol uptake facilitator protein